MNADVKTNKMEVMRESRLLFSISIPIIISMIVQALYNIVDSIFVASYNNIEGTGALTLAFPVQNLLLATSVGMAVGINALLSRSLGQRRYEKANKIAGQGFFLMCCGYIIFLVFGIFFVDDYAASQAGGNPLLAEYTTEYLTVVCIGSISVFVQILSERLLQATGRSLLSMVTQASGAIVNIILDPILIFGMLGMPEMGVFGAAIATVIGQVVAAVLGIFFNLRYNEEIRIKIKNFIPDFAQIKEILTISIPSVLMQAVGTVMTLCMNMILMNKFNEIAMNVFGVYFKLQSFVLMPIFGLNSGMVPIIAYNYGAKRPDRVYKTMRISYVAAIGYTVLGFLTFQVLPETLLSIFSAGPEMLEIGRVALRVISISFIFAGFSIISISVCQALGKSMYALFVSVGRQLVVLIPVAFMLSLLGDVNLVWWAFPIAELMSLVLSAIFLIETLRSTFGKKSEVKR